MKNSPAASSPSIQLQPLIPGSTDPGSPPVNIVETSRTDAGLGPTSGAITPNSHTSSASPVKQLSIRDDELDDATKELPLSRKWIIGIAVLFLVGTVAFAVSSGLVQSNEARLTRSYPDLFDPGCIDKLGDSESPAITQAFDLDLTFGNFTFTHAKILDVAWDTAIGQGGRLLHGWILYRCVMRRLLIHAMEYYCVTYRYYLTISWSRASFESLYVILRDCFLMQGIASFLCTLLLIYALSYTLFFSLLWSTATGYLSLSHRLYAMSDGNIVPLNTRDLALCWVLDGSRFGSADDRIEIGPDFSTLGTLANPFKDTETKPCLNTSSIEDPYFNSSRLVYTSGGWKVDTTTTIWDHFGTINGSNNIGQSSENFQSIRACGWTTFVAPITRTIC